MRNNSRYIPITKNASLYYTVTELSSQGKARILVYLETVDAENTATTHRSIKKTVTCDLGDEDSYRAYLEAHKDPVYRELLRIAERDAPEVYNSLAQKHKGGKPPTILEFFEKYWTHIVMLFGWDSSTPDQYYLTIKNQLAPLLVHKPMCDLRLNDYEEAIAKLIEARAAKGKPEYSNSRLEKFRTNLSAVADYARIIGYCDTNPLSGYTHKLNPLARVQRESFLRKSLTASETSKVVRYLVENFWSDPRIIGTFFQLLDARPAECGGLTFCDIIRFKDQPERSYVAIHAQYTQKSESEGNNQTLDLKTNNGYRFIPLPLELQILIDALWEKLLGLGFRPEEINLMPIIVAPQGNVMNYYKRCGPRKISDCGKEALCDTVGRRHIFEIPRIVNEENGTEVILPLEADSNAYDFRRITATRFYSVGGLTLQQLQYIMGHALDLDLYGRAFEFANEDWLGEIRRKLDRVIFVTDVADGSELLQRMARPDPREQIKTIDMSKGPVDLRVTDEITKRLKIQSSSTRTRIKVRINLQAIEPDEGIDISVRSDGMSGTIVPLIARTTGSRPPVTTNIQNAYLDELFGESVEKTPEASQDDSEEDDNEEYDNAASNAAYEEAWGEYTEAEPPAENEDDE